MPLTRRICRVPLGAHPEIVSMGLSTHHSSQRGRYQLDDLWSLHLYRYQARVTFGGEDFQTSPGAVSIVPPGTLMQYRYPHDNCRHAYALFRLGRAAPVFTVPTMQHAGSQFESLYGKMEEATRFRAAQPLHAAVRLWDVLLSVAQLEATASSSSRHPALAAIVDWIELHLADPPTPAQLRKRFGYSHNHLNHLFKRDMGCTLGQYTRRRRVRHAVELIRRTQLPIKAIAAEVGFADLQQFNKLLRREAGMAPRALRER